MQSGHLETSSVSLDQDLVANHSSIQGARRESYITNDDDYDYALELEADEEYRQTALTLNEVEDFPDKMKGNTLSPIKVADASKINRDKDPSKGLFSSMSGFIAALGQRRPVSNTRNSTSDIIPSTSDIEAGVFTSQYPHGTNTEPGYYNGPFESSETKGNVADDNVSDLDENEIDPQFDADGAIHGNLSEEERYYDDNDDDQQSNLTGTKELTRNIFITRIKSLNRRKKWAETAIRRSSQNFLNNYETTGKAAMDRFIVIMSRGITVRRHQALCNSEIVRIFSDDGCHSINWEPPRGEGNSENSRVPNEIVSTPYDTLTCSCCISVCGCGDNLDEENDLFRVASRSSYSGRVIAGEVDVQPDDTTTRIGNLQTMINNFRYQRRGRIEDSHLVAVQPSTRNDPTKPGFIGTDSFRRSKDAYNQALSFSVVSRFLFGSVTTLDIECSTEEEYFVLLSGFLMLCTETHFREEKLKKEKSEEKVNRLESLSAGCADIWQKSQMALFPPAAQKMNSVDALFYVSSGVLLPLVMNDKLPVDYDENEMKLKYDMIPPKQFLGWKSAGTQIWARLRLAGLDVKCIFSWDLTKVILKLKCPLWRLEEVAEKMHMKLRRRDGTYKRFKRSRRETFMAAGFNGSIFRSTDRQRIIDYILRSKLVDGGAELDEDTKLGSCIKSRFPLHMHERLEHLKHSWVTFWKIEQPGEISVPWSILDTSLIVTANRIKTSFTWTWDGLLSQPLDNIAEYYGEDVAFYFAWVSFFSRWLILPSILGFIVFCVQVNQRRLDIWLCIPYAAFVIMWSCFLLAFWRQKAATLAHRWGVLDYEVEEAERPQFKGQYAYDANLGEIRKLYPSWRRLMKYLVSYPLILLFVGSVLILMIVTSTTNQAISEQYSNGEAINYKPRFKKSFGLSDQYSTSANITSINYINSTLVNDDIISGTVAQSSTLTYWIVNLFYPSVYGVVTNIAAEIFERLAVVLNDFENHQTDSSYWNQLIIKIFSVRFVTVFTSIFFYAFQNGLDSETSYFLMSTSIFAFLTIGDWWGKFIEICVPAWLQRLYLYRMKSAVVTLRRMIWKMRADKSIDESKMSLMIRRQNYLKESQQQCWAETLKADYTTFGDYTRLMIQLGFVLFFAAVFPLSPLIVLINNVFFIRLDAFKLTNTRKRPIAHKSAGLGVWEDILQVMSVAGIITNCCIVGITSSVLPNYMRAYGAVAIAISLFFFEHIMLFFKYMLHKSIPKIPIAVQRDVLGIRQYGSNSKPQDKKRKPRRSSNFGDVMLNNEDNNDGRGNITQDCYVSNYADSTVPDLSSKSYEQFEDINANHYNKSSNNAIPQDLNPDVQNNTTGSETELIRDRMHTTKEFKPINEKIPVHRNRRSSLFSSERNYVKSEKIAASRDQFSDDSSEDDDVTISRLQAKILALKLKTKQNGIMDQGNKFPKLDQRRNNAASEQSIPSDSAWALARKRVAEANKIPFQSMSISTPLGSFSQTPPDGVQSSVIQRMETDAIITDPSVLIGRSFLKHSKSRDEDNAKQVELTNMSSLKKSASRNYARGHQGSQRSTDDSSVVSQLTEATTTQQSIGSSAWGMMGNAANALGQLGVGLKSKAKANIQLPTHQEVEDRATPPINKEYNSSNSTKQQHQLNLVPLSKSRGFAQSQVNDKMPQNTENISNNGNVPYSSPSIHATGRGPSKKNILKPISNVKPAQFNHSTGIPTMRTMDSPASSPPVSVRSQEAFKTHISRNKAAAAAAAMSTLSPTEVITTQTNNSPLKPKNLKAKKLSVSSFQSDTGNSWENIPESACFIRRLNNDTLNADIAPSFPFSSIVQDHQRTVDRKQCHHQMQLPDENNEWEESPSDTRRPHSKSPPTKSILSLLVQEYGGSRQEDEDNEYEDSPPTPVRAQKKTGAAQSPKRPENYSTSPRSLQRNMMEEFTQFEVSEARHHTRGPSSSPVMDPFRALTSPQSSSQPPRKHSPLMR